MRDGARLGYELVRSSIVSPSFAKTTAGGHSPCRRRIEYRKSIGVPENAHVPTPLRSAGSSRGKRLYGNISTCRRWYIGLLEEERPGGRFEGLMDTIRSRLHDPLTVVELAAIAGMSPRNFSRCFTAETDLAPAKAVERVRAECARAQLRGGGRSVAEVVVCYGFGNSERMRRALLRVYGIGSSVLRMT